MPDLVSFTSIYAVIRENSRTQLIFYSKICKFPSSPNFFYGPKKFCICRKRLRNNTKTGD